MRKWGLEIFSSFFSWSGWKVTEKIVQLNCNYSLEKRGCTYDRGWGNDYWWVCIKNS